VKAFGFRFNYEDSTRSSGAFEPRHKFRMNPLAFHDPSAPRCGQPFNFPSDAWSCRIRCRDEQVAEFGRRPIPNLNGTRERIQSRAVWQDAIGLDKR
jgi:hypothetical protein